MNWNGFVSDVKSDNPPGIKLRVEGAQKVVSANAPKLFAATEVTSVSGHHMEIANQLVFMTQGEFEAELKVLHLGMHDMARIKGLMGRNVRTVSESWRQGLGFRV